MTTNIRWTRLEETLSEAGIQATTYERPYPGGINYSIDIRVPGGHIHIGDTEFRGSWSGWQAYIENGETAISKHLIRSKKCSEITAAVVEAIAKADHYMAVTR